MTIYTGILKALEGGPLSAQQLSEITELPKSTIKIAVYTMYKRGQVARVKQARNPELKGPKQEYIYARPSL